MERDSLIQSARTSVPGIGQNIYPYRLRDLVIKWSNQVWATGIRYIPIARNFICLVTITKWRAHHMLTNHETTLSMDGRRPLGGILLVEHLWGYVKCANICPDAYESTPALKRNFEKYFRFQSVRCRQTARDP